MQRLQTDLFAIRGHQVEATGGDVQVDGHASKLQVALPEDAGQGFRWWLHQRRQVKPSQKCNNSKQCRVFLPFQKVFSALC